MAKAEKHITFHTLIKDAATEVLPGEGRILYTSHVGGLIENADYQQEINDRGGDFQAAHQRLSREIEGIDSFCLRDIQNARQAGNPSLGDP